jgi:SAM-dependent methyltransferase
MNYAGEYQTRERMDAKLKAVRFPESLEGLSVLDVGCDHGFWCELAVDRGAVDVLGLDRGRNVRGRGFVNLAKENADLLDDARFAEIELGRQWREFGQFDLVLVMSVYHHIFEQAGGDHDAVWYWLWRHAGGRLIWEGPTGDDDSVVRRNVTHPYRRIDILNAALRWFHIDAVRPALHEPTREVWECRPRAENVVVMPIEVRSGAGGASVCFNHADGRRIKEVEEIVGWRAYPGSLNLHTQEPFDWDRGYYRSRVLDLVNRRTGLSGEWAPKWARLYPVTYCGVDALAFRFEGESYSPHLVELIAPVRLREYGDVKEIQRCLS